MPEQITSLAQVVKEKLIKSALDDSDMAALEKAAIIWRSVAEAEKAEVEMAAAIRTAHSEKLRFWIPILAPVLTAVALVSTLMFQVQQFKVNSELQKQNSEDSQWRDALTYAKSSDGKENAIALSIVRSFFDSSRYSKEAREVAEVLMADTSHPVIFRRHLEELVQRTTWDNFQNIVIISRALLRFYEREELKDEAQKSQTKAKDGIQNEPESTDQNNYKLNLEEQLIATSGGVVRFLRKGHPRPSNVALDLSDSALWDQDLSKIDFSKSSLSKIWIRNSTLNGANLHGATLGNQVIINTSVKDADFGEVQLDRSFVSTWGNWWQTAWWRAKSISPELLKYLQEKYPFSSEVTYRDDNTKDYADYKREVDRLIGNK